MIYNILPIEFHTLFNNTIKHDIIDGLLAYKLFKDNMLNLRNKETKRLISYFITYHLVKKIKESKEDKTVIVIQPFIINECQDLCDSTIHPSLCIHIKTILKILSKSYPTNIVFLKHVMAISSKDTIVLLFNKCNKFLSADTREFKAYSNSNFSNTPG
jgi:hypothetical protein